MRTLLIIMSASLTSVAVGDINNDKYLDIVVLDANNRVFTFLGQGNATFIMITTTYQCDAFELFFIFPC